MTTPSPSLADVFFPFIGLAIVGGLWALMFRSPTPRRTVTAGGGGRSQPVGAGPGGAPPTLAGQRSVTVLLADPNNHPYDNLPITELHEHMFNDHFESWNLLGDAAPERFRKEHAADHGLVLR